MNDSAEVTVTMTVKQAVVLGIVTQRLAEAAGRNTGFELGIRYNDDEMRRNGNAAISEFTNAIRNAEIV